MRKKALSLIVAGVLGAIVIVGCGGAEKKQEAPSEVTQDQYQCPMKCTEEIFSKPDTCKVCGMDLEKITTG
ncbi:hypothetical protein BH10BAC1_BH10BAC1_09110 [soil metagenome]